MRKANDKDFAEMAEVINQRGYLVIGSDTHYEVGHQIKDWSHNHGLVEHPVTVIAVTDWADICAQGAFWNMPPRLTPTRKYYYRVITD